MQSKVKITKRQIKEDKFTTFMLTAKERVVENWQFAVIGVVVLILVIAGSIYYVDSRGIAKDEAGEQFARAMIDYRNGDYQIAILGLTQLTEQYPGDEVSEEATYLLGKLNLVNRNYSEATRFFNMYLDKYRSNPINRSASLAGIAICQENQAEYAQAATKFLEAAAAFEGGPLEGDYYLGALRNYLKADNAEAARSQLEVLDTKFFGTQWLNQGQLLFYEKGLTESSS